ncbi:MAG: CHASE2 domain-containing protein [Planctomycetota bacterium]
MRKPSAGFILATLLGLLAALYAWPAPVLRSLEATTWAARVRWAAKPSPVSNRIKLIVVDDKSLQWVTRQYPDITWPWPRSYFAAILDFCRKGGAKGVGFDILFTEPSAHGVDDDERFREALEGMQGRAYLAARVEGGRFGSLAPRLDAAASKGHVEAVFDADEGMILRVKPCIEGEGQRLWLLGFLGDAGKGDFPPTNDKGEMLLKYPGSFGAHEVFAACDIIGSALSLEEGSKPLVDPALFKDAYVLVGYRAGGLHDLRPTPFDDVTPGVEIHAVALDNFLEGQGYWTSSAHEGGETIRLFLCTIAAMVGALAVFAKRTMHEFVILGLAVLLPLALAAGGAVAKVMWWIPLVAPISAALVSGGAALSWNYIREGRQRRFLKTAFSQYLSPEIVRRLTENPGALKLGGEMRELTMFFSDLKGFSTFSEKMDPQTLTRFLNGFLTEMTGIILEEGGTLDKYVGDAIIAFWNAPMTQENHAERAVRAALRCQARIRELNPGYKKEFGVELFLRVGLNTAQVVVGNMGSAQRFSYTMFGDGANLASRLEGANKGFGTLLMISEATGQALRGAYVLRELGLIRVPGRSQAVRVFEPQSAKEPSPEIQRYHQALSNLRAGKVAEAREAFAQWLDDPPSRVYRERCEDILSGVMASWDGVWDLKEK